MSPRPRSGQAFNEVVLEHFRRPQNRGRLTNADVTEEGANPLCGDRIMIELAVDRAMVRDARFTADACAICIAVASLLTSRVRGAQLAHVETLDDRVASELLGGDPPAARRRCATLPVETMRRAAKRASQV